MEYLLEAKKFIQRTREAYTSEARNQHFEMAEWFIARAIEELDQSPSQAVRKFKVSPATIKLAYRLTI
jgi:hypothetical protein